MISKYLSAPVKQVYKLQKITVNFSQELDGYFFVLSWVSFLTLLTSVMMAHILIIAHVFCASEVSSETSNMNSLEFIIS